MKSLFSNNADQTFVILMGCIFLPSGVKLRKCEGEKVN